ncbi:hypothetical protein H9K76_17890 [Diaphorobacter ruginosibacter]|uniref:Uncharacterized protein n=1 Tax=Diaphorobacter ruginosibacter TaxID=1715720 RepID=A0A7G9RLC4_9BURK|nr:hypothetical protein [Diaphorobacter ruginosibacter]QNN56399.1 hypothetical protein H9K76_17890 [Diaphorobacter ruginosibacter]
MAAATRLHHSNPALPAWGDSKGSPFFVARPPPFMSSENDFIDKRKQILAPIIDRRYELDQPEKHRP